MAKFAVGALVQLKSGGIRGMVGGERYLLICME